MKATFDILDALILCAGLSSMLALLSFFLSDFLEEYSEKIGFASVFVSNFSFFFYVFIAGQAGLSISAPVVLHMAFAAMWGGGQVLMLSRFK